MRAKIAASMLVVAIIIAIYTWVVGELPIKEQADTQETIAFFIFLVTSITGFVFIAYKIVTWLWGR